LSDGEIVARQTAVEAGIRGLFIFFYDPQRQLIRIRLFRDGHTRETNDGVRGDLKPYWWNGWFNTASRSGQILFDVRERGGISGRFRTVMRRSSAIAPWMEVITIGDRRIETERVAQECSALNKIRNGIRIDRAIEEHSIPPETRCRVFQRRINQDPRRKKEEVINEARRHGELQTRSHSRWARG